MKTKLYNSEAKAIGEVELSDEFFGRPWNADLVHQAMVAQAANRRGTYAHTKDRSEVRGGGKKPWQQKGTGRSRHGSIRSPLWPGGGVTHGPRSSKVFGKKINKKMKRAALFAALSEKLRRNDVRVIEGLTVPEPRTKQAAAILRAFGDKKSMSVLFIPSLKEKNLFRASANIPRTKSLHAPSLNVEDVLRYQNIFIDKEAITEIK